MRGRRVKWVAAWGRVGGEAATGAERPVGVSGWPTAAMRRRGGILRGPPGTPGGKTRSAAATRGHWRAAVAPSMPRWRLVTSRGCDPIGQEMGLTSTGWP